MSDVDPYRDDAPPELAEVRSGEDLDWKRIEAYLREKLPADLGTLGDFEVQQFPNGAANLTYLIRFGKRELVLRRPPFGTIAPGAHDMKREFKVLSRLWRVFDRAPQAYLSCDDPKIAGADFFVMERKRGEVVRGVIPETMREHEHVGRRIGFALVDCAFSIFVRVEIADALAVSVLPHPHRLDPNSIQIQPSAGRSTPPESSPHARAGNLDRHSSQPARPLP